MKIAFPLYSSVSSVLSFLEEMLINRDSKSTPNWIRTNDQKPANTWDGSTAQLWCSGFASTTNFSSEELTAIPMVSGGSYLYEHDGELNDDQVFFLSADEYRTYSSHITNVNEYWWLRSPDFDGSGAGSVVPDGSAHGYIVDDDNVWARPAFNLNLNSVLFTSAAEGGKSSGAEGAAALKLVSDTTPTEWKLTLKDYDNDSATTLGHDGFSASAASSSTTTVEYSGASTGANEYISAIVQDDSNNNILYYGRLKNVTAAEDAGGTVEVLLPFDMTGKTLYVFNEQYNGDKMTDYASDLKTVSGMTKNAHAVTYSLTNMESDGLAAVKMGEEYTATLTADNNYTLPATITVKIGNDTLTVGTDYTYDSTNGKLIIAATSIGGDIEIHQLRTPDAGNR